jgi:hypothetical protein
MEAEDPLSDLADIHLPDAVPFWPPAPGWWVLAALLLAGLCWLGWLQFRAWQRRQRMQAALNELASVYRTYNERPAEAGTNEAGLAFLHGCNEILKRVALEHYPVLAVARLNGREWLGFLDVHGNTNGFSAGAGQVLGDGSYRPRFDADVDAVQALCSDWIRLQYRKQDAAADDATDHGQGVTA